MSLPDSIQLLERYSAVILPGLVVAEQIGIPLPAVPALLAVGALAAQGRVSLLVVIGAIALVALPVDLVWHELGRRRGARVLSGLCRLSMEPDVCVRRTEGLFVRHGVRALLVAKFLPGLTTVMPPLAGIFGVPRFRFALYDVAGILLWAGLWTGIGYLFSDAIEVIAGHVSALGHTTLLVVVAALVAYVGLKYVRRQLFLRRLRIARISPESLKQKLDAGEDVAIFDLRTGLDVVATPFAIPGSRWIPAETLAEHLSEIPRDRELVLYCS
jgi:membrane protein DedA with SNARE-associated domain